MYSHELQLAWLLGKKVKQNRKRKGKGCFGRVNQDKGNYKTLKVIKRSERTEENCNQSGVSNE